MSKPTLTEIIDQFQRAVVAAVIDHVTALLAPLAPIAPAPPSVSKVIARGHNLARGPAAALPATKSMAKPPKAAKRTPGEKRPRAVLAALTEVLATYITKHPGQRIEQIGVALMASTADLKRSMNRLIAAKRARTTGARRATRYFPVAKK